MNLPFRALVFAGLLAGLWPAAAPAGEPAAQLEPKLRDEVGQLVGALDAEEFASRERAFERLGELADQAELKLPLAVYLKHVLVAQVISLEARGRINEVLGRLPEVQEPVPEVELSPSDIARTVEALNVHSAAHREHAAEQIALLLRNSKLVCPLMLEMKRRLADPAFHAEGSRRLEQLWEQARCTWVLSNSAKWPLPVVPDAQIVRWIDDLVSTDDDRLTHLRCRTAERELVDLLARADYAPKVQELVADRLKALTSKSSQQRQPHLTELSPQLLPQAPRLLDSNGTFRGSAYPMSQISQSPEEDAEERLQRVYEWSRPAMVAEVWLNRRHVTIQYLLIGVPQFPEGGVRATHFDRIDDHTAHCVSGNQLVEGDYPVGVAIPHPQGLDRTFQLINLPTAREHLAYDFLVKRPEDVRLRELSQRTVDAILADKHALSRFEIRMLLQLDPKVVSAFAGRYLEAVSDAPFSQPDEKTGVRESFPPEPSTVHSALCLYLAYNGTHECIPSLKKVAVRMDPGGPGVHSPYELAWLAALLIAERDPWPQVDDWLADVVTQDTPLVLNAKGGPELGASAAALLLTRHEMSHAAFGVESVGEVFPREMPFNGYRFTAPEQRKKVLEWWRTEKARQVAQQAG